MVVFDTTTLLCFLEPGAKAPSDPKTGETLTRVKERIDFLVRELEKRKQRIIIPTPVLSELLVHAGDAGSKYLDILNKEAAFKIVNFDQRAAVEAALAIREATNAGDKRNGSKSTWAKIKFDRQVIAIAKVEKASAIYSDDEDILKLAKNSEIAVIRTNDLPLPPEDAQREFPFVVETKDKP